MSLPALLDKSAAILRRDLLTAVRYRNGFFLQSVAMEIEIAGAYYLARAVGPGFRPEGIDYYPYLLVGTGFVSFVMSGMRLSLSRRRQTIFSPKSVGSVETR